MDNKGVILAVERSRERLRALRSNLSRLGVEIAVVLKWDARFLGKLEIKADKVLLDAPCSGEGLTPIDPSRRVKTKFEDLTRFSKIQEELLMVAYNIAKQGGTIVYSTCSIAPEENEFVINSVLERLKGKLKVAPLNIGYGEKGYTRIFGYELDPSLEYCRRFYPHKHGCEGFFICKLVKEE